MENVEARFAKYWEHRFGRRVKDLRLERGWTQDELAKRLNGAGYSMHQTTVAKMESGARPTSVGEMAALAAIFGMSIDRLFSDDAPVDRAMSAMAAATAECVRAADEIVDLSQQTDAAKARLVDSVTRVGELAAEASGLPGWDERRMLFDALQGRLQDAKARIEHALGERIE